MQACSPGGAVGEGDFRADVRHVDDRASDGVLGGINDQLEGDFDLVRHVLAADLVLAQAKGAALAGAGRALAPADGSNT